MPHDLRRNPTTRKAPLQVSADIPRVSIKTARVKPEFRLFGTTGVTLRDDLGSTQYPDQDMSWQQAFVELGRERAKSEILENDLAAARSVIANLRGQNEENERRLLDAERIISRLDEELDTLREKGRG